MFMANFQPMISKFKDTNLPLLSTPTYTPQRPILWPVPGFRTSIVSNIMLIIPFCGFKGSAPHLGEKSQAVGLFSNDLTCLMFSFFSSNAACPHVRIYKHQMKQIHL
jgi:hypothetical protein